MPSAKERLFNLEVTAQHPILMIGGEGLVGRGLSQTLSDQFGGEAVKSASRSGEVALDITNRASVERAFRETHPGLIMHLGAATNVNLCEQKPEWAYLVNGEGTRHVIQAAGDTPVIYFSTDFVFDGLDFTLKREMDVPNPQSVYGQSKLAGEMALLESNNPGMIIRISFPWYKVSEHLENPALKDSLWWIASKMVSGQDVPAYTNVVGNWTPMAELQSDLVKALGLGLNRRLKILHLSGAIPTTPYQAAVSIRRLLEAYEVEGLGRVNPVKFVPEPGQTAPRPAAGGLDTSLAWSLGLGETSVPVAIASGQWLTGEDLARLR